MCPNEKRVYALILIFLLQQQLTTLLVFGSFSTPSFCWFLFCFASFFLCIFICYSFCGRTSCKRLEKISFYTTMCSEAPEGKNLHNFHEILGKTQENYGNLHKVHCVDSCIPAINLWDVIILSHFHGREQTIFRWIEWCDTLKCLIKGVWNKQGGQKKPQN